jgi:phospholipid/cholesterol/gamma-HCH transport system permease protein
MPEAEAEVREEAPGRATVKLRGWLSAQSTAECWRELQTQLAKLSPRSLTIDASEVKVTGGIGAALLRYLAEGGMTPGAQVILQGLNKQAETILNTFTSEDYRQYRPQPPPKVPLIAEVGAFVCGWWQGLRHEVAFIGSVMRALPQAVIRPRRMRWREVRCVIETAGANALPVVAVICVLTGVVTVLEASHPLAKFGAQIFLADVIGFSSLRDTGPMVTAILLAGRSGSAFAAELGTMKVNEELDALTTMGLDPVRFLVLQRIVAAIILTPLLTLFGMLMCMLGGMLVMRSLGFPPLMIFHHILNRVGMGDFAVGLSKAAIFGLVIGSVACLRGLQTGTGPSAVGASTTRSVIACILLIIVADTIFSAAQYFLT